MKRIAFVVALFTVFGLTGVAQEYQGFKVNGRFLYDGCGEKTILRGVNYPNIWFQHDGMPHYEEIDKTGANVIRIVWETKGDENKLDEAITNCRNLNMIPMVELHDATGDFSKLQTCVDYWTSDEMVSIIQYHENYLLINIANEAGAWGVSKADFRSTYTNIVTTMRNAGIRVPLVIDATDWGKNIDILQSEGPALIEADPEHNLLFSVHMWWPAMYGYSESDIAEEIKESVEMELPLIVGEFSQMHGECTDAKITASNSIAYYTILKECQENQVGYIAWSWFGNCNPNWDMSTNGSFDNLYDWGLEVAVTDPNSIQNTSVRPYYMVNDVCNPDDTLQNVSIRETLAQNNTFHLQNHPNPFSEKTTISFQVNKPGNVVIHIFDMAGKQVNILNKNTLSTGYHKVMYINKTLKAGLYWYSISVHENKEWQKMIITN